MADIQYPIIYDLSLDGGIDSKGNLNQLWNVDALMNSIRMWFASFQGEVLRAPQLGGVLTAQLNKPMAQVDVDFLESAIRSGFNNEFRPKLQIESLEIKPDYEKHFYEIVLSAYSPDAGLFIEVDERIRAMA